MRDGLQKGARQRGGEVSGANCQCVHGGVKSRVGVLAQEGVRGKEQGGGMRSVLEDSVE